MDSTDGSEHIREIEEEGKTLVSDNLLEDLTSMYEPDKEESTINAITDEVPEYLSRSREEVEIGSSVAPGAGDSELLVETEIESEPHIVLARDTPVGKEDHEAVDINEKNQKDTQQIHEDSPIEHTLVTEIEASNEALGTHDFINDQTEAKYDKNLGMNIKIAVDDDTVEESVPSVSIAAEKQKVEHRETITSEETTPVSEITTVAKLCEFESDADTLEVAAEQEDTEEAVKENSQSTETENIVLGAVMDDFDIETTDVSMTEAEVNNEIDKEEESVLGMNIRVEEGKTKQVDTEEESKIYTFVDQEESHEVVGLKEKLTELEEYSSCEQHGGIHETDLLATSELKPVIKLKGEVTKDKEDETAAELEESFSRTNPAESQVPFVPNGIEEAIEFIDSETLELQKGPPINGENHTETVTDLVIGSSLAADSGRLVRDESSSAHEEESVESGPVVPPRPSHPPLSTSSAHLADASNENIFGSSTEATKSTGRSRIRKPEWMRRSLVRSGSVRRLFSRMRSKRFGHDQYPVTPEPEPRPPPRPFRQMVVDFLLLLFES